MNELTKRELSRGRRLTAAAVAAPVVLTSVPLAVTFALLLLTATSPPVSFVILVIGLIAAALGLIVGGTLSAVFLRRRSEWSREVRSYMAARGINADEIDWFRKELRSSEKKALKAVEARDLMLGDAYRETLASRLTASRILQSARHELSLSKRRQLTLRNSKSERAADFRAEIDRDIAKLNSVQEEARIMLDEAQSRMQMIESAAMRQGSLADNQTALKKLSARTKELPLALEAAKMSDEIRQELENEEAM